MRTSSTNLFEAERHVVQLPRPDAHELVECASFAKREWIARFYSWKGVPLTQTERKVQLCAWLALFGMLGAYIRYYLVELAEVTIAPALPTLLSQFIGSFVLGFLSGHKLTVTTPSDSILFTAISTGLCGSITTFSSWSLEVNDILLQWSSNTKLENQFLDGGTDFRVVGWMHAILLGLVCAMGGLKFGFHLSEISPWRDDLTLHNVSFAKDNRNPHSVVVNIKRGGNSKLADYGTPSRRHTIGVCIGLFLVLVLIWLTLLLGSDNKNLFCMLCFAPFGRLKSAITFNY